MSDWLFAPPAPAMPAVLVTVAATEGSVPREAGAKMWVQADRLIDTIGGGHLEWRAADIAREMLAAGAAAHIRRERFALGPSLGQCCGGVAHLVFEYFDADALSWLSATRDAWQRCQAVLRVRQMEPADSDQWALFDCQRRWLAGTLSEFPAVLLERPSTHCCRLYQAADGGRWLLDPCRPPSPHLMVFGAGHVGTALINALAALPCRVTWVDERADAFPAHLPSNVRIEVSDAPDSLAASAPSGTDFLVMTHSHALDQTLCEVILKRQEPAWLGLIGSHTKRRQFEHRLSARGVDPDRLADMACPIGIDGITGKLPAVIAASVAAQLLRIWETRAHAIPRATPGTKPMSETSRCPFSNRSAP